MATRYLILGVSAASLGVLNKLRSLDEAGSITCLASQEEAPFNLCLIADVLSGARVPAEVLTKDSSFFSTNKIDLHLGEKVVQLDRAAKTVTTEKGNRYEYDVLFIGTGTTPFIPPLFTESHAENVFTFQSLKTTEAILAYCKKNNVKTAMVIGGGLTGIECADALTHRGIAITIIERGPHLMPHTLTHEGATLLESLIRKCHVKILANTSITNLSVQDQKIKALLTQSGEKISTDLVICATGSRPNSAFALEAGLEEHKNRINVSEYLRTNDAAIFAAGDVSTVPHLLSRKPTPSMAWPDAMMQGMHAAHNMARLEKAYPGLLPLISSRFFGTGFVSAGDLIAEQTDTIKVDESDIHYHFFVITAAHKLKGFMLVGKLDHIGKYRSALTKQEELNESFFNAL